MTVAKPILEMTATEAKAFIRKIMGPPSREIVGLEKEHLLTMFTLLTPLSSSNNQHSWTDVYEHANKTYHVTTFPGNAVNVDEILPDDIE